MAIFNSYVKLPEGTQKLEVQAHIYRKPVNFTIHFFSGNVNSKASCMAGIPKAEEKPWTQNAWRIDGTKKTKENLGKLLQVDVS